MCVSINVQKDVGILFGCNDHSKCVNVLLVSVFVEYFSTKVNADLYITHVI